MQEIRFRVRVVTRDLKSNLIVLFRFTAAFYLSMFCLLIWGDGPLHEALEAALILTIPFSISMLYPTFVLHDVNKAGWGREYLCRPFGRPFNLQVYLSDSGFRGDLRLPRKCINSIVVKNDLVHISINNSCPFQTGELTVKILSISDGARKRLLEMSSSFSR